MDRESWCGDLWVARRIAGEARQSPRIREIVGFHCQQAAEKCLKAVRTRWQIEYPKTHDIKTLLPLVGGADARAAGALPDARWLTPLGVDIRCPGDPAELLPGDEVKPIERAASVELTVLAILAAA